MQLIQNLGRWIRALIHWVVDAWRVWVPLLVVMLVLLVASKFPLSWADSVLRYFGLAFQLLGILTVVLGLRDKRRLFNRPTLVENIRHWMNRRPRWGTKRQTFLETGTGSFSLIGGSAKFSVWRKAPANAPVEARLAALEANLA